MTSEPTMREILIRLDNIAKQQEDLLHQLREDRRSYTETFLRADLYRTEHKAQEDDIAGLKERLDKADNFRRTVISGVSIQAIVILAGLMLAISNYMAGGAS